MARSPSALILLVGDRFFFFGFFLGVLSCSPAGGFFGTRAALPGVVFCGFNNLGQQSHVACMEAKTQAMFSSEILERQHRERERDATLFCVIFLFFNREQKIERARNEWFMGC